MAQNDRKDVVMDTVEEMGYRYSTISSTSDLSCKLF